MIQILTLIRFAFPFLLLTAFFCLYRKKYGFMKRFMWKMAMFQSARNLYAYLSCTDAYLHQLVLPCHGSQSLCRSVNTPDLGASEQENRRKHLPSFA